MKSDNVEFRISRPVANPRALLNKELAEKRVAQIIEAPEAKLAVLKRAKDTTDQFFDVQQSAGLRGWLQPRRFRRDGREVFIDGDRYMLATFSIGHGPVPLETNNNLRDLMRSVADLCYEDTDRLSVCEVGYWLFGDGNPSDAEPCDVKTLYEVQHYHSPSEDQETKP